jgi:hypothetical protein
MLDQGSKQVKKSCKENPVTDHLVAHNLKKKSGKVMEHCLLYFD